MACPAGSVRYHPLPIGSLVGTLITWQHSFAGHADRSDTNSFTCQTLGTFGIGGGYYIRSSGVMTFDEVNGRYLIPLGVGAGKVFKAGSATGNAFIEPQFTIYHQGIGQPMIRCRLIPFGVRGVEWIVALAWISCLAAHAQDTQFLPELDGHLTLNHSFKVYVQAKDDREGGDPQQFTFGPSLQFYRKPLMRLKNASVFDLDDAKSRLLVIESGYRVITTPNTPPKNRAIEDVTFRFPLQGRALLTDKNRADLDWQSGTFTWRYRNKLTLQRTFSFRSFHFISYLAAEPFYESRYSKWSTTNLYAGSLFPVGGHAQFDCYYQHENNTGKTPNQQEEFIGLALHLYFSRQ